RLARQLLLARRRVDDRDVVGPELVERFVQQALRGCLHDVEPLQALVRGLLDPFGGAGLRVGVDERDAATVGGRREGGQVHGRGGLAHAALERSGDDDHSRSLPGRSGDAKPQPGSPASLTPDAPARPRRPASMTPVLWPTATSMLAERSPSAFEGRRGMPNLAEVRAQLTGPGGPFEVVTEDVLGRPMQVYQDRMRTLRAIPQAAIGRGDDTFLVYGDRSYGFREFVEETNGLARALADRCGIGPGDRVAVLSQNNPEWCLTFWATVSMGAILVGLNGWWKADEILYGLQDSGANVLVADATRFGRRGARAGEAPDLTQVLLIDAGPDDFPV